MKNKFILYVSKYSDCAYKSANFEHINLQHREEVLHINIAWLFLWIRDFESIRIVGGITNVSIFSEGIFRVVTKKIFHTLGKRAQNLFLNQMGNTIFNSWLLFIKKGYVNYDLVGIIYLTIRYIRYKQILTRKYEPEQVLSD